MSRGRSRRAESAAPCAPEPFPAAPPPPTATRLLAVLLAVLVLGVYGFTLNPSIPGGDSGEFIGVAATTGVAHPSGYPLHTLLAKLFLLVPAGSVAWRVNLLSACCDTLAAVLLMLAVTRYTRDGAAGVLAGGLFAFCPLIWTYAVVAEVFALNNLCVAALIYCCVRYAEAEELAWARRAALIIGLGLSNHHTLVFIAFPMILWAITYGERRLMDVGKLAQLAGLTLAGLLPYLYLPVAAARIGAISWGDQTTLDGFLHHFLRRDYGTLSLAGNPNSVGPGLFSQLAYYAADLVHQSLMVGWLLAIAGLVAALKFRRTRSLGAAIGVAFSFYMLVFHAIANLPIQLTLFRGVHARFWQQADLLVFFWLGVGFAAHRARLGSRAVPIAVGLVFLQLVVHFRTMDQHDNLAVRDYGLAVLKTLPPRALVLCQGDLITSPLLYLTQVEKIRPDVRVLDQSLMTYRWMKRILASRCPDVQIPGERYFPGDPAGYDIRRFLEANLDRSPIVVCGGFREGDASANGVFELWPLGVGDLVTRPGSGMSFATWLPQSAKALPTYPIPDSERFGPETWEYVVKSDYWIARHRRAFRILVEGLGHNDSGLLEQARVALEEIVAGFPDCPAYVYKNIGLVYSRLLDRRPDAKSRMVAAWRHYLDLEPTNDPDLASIQQAVRQ